MAGVTPTIVLVHGAWADATGFDAEIRALHDRGYAAVGFGNPLRDLAGDAAYLAEFLQTLNGPIVLVGHSYGGNVISVAAIGNEQVRALVFLNGWMCDVGESQQQLLERFEGSLVGPSIRPVAFTNPDGSETVVRSPDPGRALVTGDARSPLFDSVNAFKIPSLWGVRRTAPYFHDNSAKTLEAVAAHYARFFAVISTPRGEGPPALVLTEQDLADIVAYLRLLD